MMHHARPRFRALLAVCPAVFLATATAASAQQIAGTNGAPVPALEWRACPEDVAPAPYQCSVAEVPLSYRDPDGQSLELVLGRLPAAEPGPQARDALLEPRRPGRLGPDPVPVLAGPARALRPRRLRPARHRRLDAAAVLSPPTSRRSGCSASAWPITLAQEQDYVQRTARGTEVCARNGGPILAHMSTANVARDLDLLRQAVGDRQLTYLGYSYGTAIGAYYANLFPDKVRALTLDAVIDPVEWTTGRTPAEAQLPVEYRLGSFHGAAQALTTFLSECARDARCAFREPGVDLRAKYDRMLARVKRSPVEIEVDGERYLVDLPVRCRRDARPALQLVRRAVPRRGPADHLCGHRQARAPARRTRRRSRRAGSSRRARASPPTSRTSGWSGSARSSAPTP